MKIDDKVEKYLKDTLLDIENDVNSVVDGLDIESKEDLYFNAEKIINTIKKYKK